MFSDDRDVSYPEYYIHVWPQGSDDPERGIEKLMPAYSCRVTADDLEDRAVTLAALNSMIGALQWSAKWDDHSPAPHEDSPLEASGTFPAKTAWKGF